MLTTDQLSRRKTGVGASEVGAALGMSKYKTKFQLYLEKIGEIEQTESNLPLRFGNAVEPFILDEFEANHNVKLIRSPDTLRNGIMLCHLDAWLPGEYIVQAKTAGILNDWGEPGTDEVPEEYALQVQSEMMLSGEKIAYIPVLFSGRTYREYIVEFDRELSELIQEGVREFWDHVETLVPPEPSTYEDVVMKYRRSSGRMMVSSPEIEAAVRDLRLSKATTKASKQAEDVLKAGIMAFMEDADTLVDANGKPLVTWKETRTRQEFDVESFKKEYPDLWAEFQVTGKTQRRFLVK